MNRREAIAALLALPVAATAIQADGHPPEPLDQWADWTDVCRSLANMEAAAIHGNHPLTGHLQTYATAIQFAEEVMLVIAVRDPSTVATWSRPNNVADPCQMLGRHASDDGAVTCIAIWANMSEGLRAQFQGDSARRERSYRRCEVAARRKRKAVRDAR